MKELYQLIFKDVLSKKIRTLRGTNILLFKNILQICWYRKVNSLIPIPFFRCHKYKMAYQSPSVQSVDDQIKYQSFLRMCRHKYMNEYIKHILENDVSIFTDRRHATLVAACSSLNFEIVLLLLSYCDDMKKTSFKHMLDHLMIVMCRHKQYKSVRWLLTNKDIMQITDFKDIRKKILREINNIIIHIMSTQTQRLRQKIQHNFDKLYKVMIENNYL